MRRGLVMEQPAALSQCLYTGGCTRRTADPSRLCHRHRHIQSGYTPGRQLVFGGNGPLGLLPKLQKEREVAPPAPEESMEIDGFPYFSVWDQKAFIDWRLGRAPRPATADILDRYPIQVAETAGAAITGSEIGVYRSDGELAVFAPDAPPTPSSGVPGEVRFLPMEDGTTMAVRSDDVYLVVIFDRNRLGSHSP